MCRQKLFYFILLSQLLLACTRPQSQDKAAAILIQVPTAAQYQASAAGKISAQTTTIDFNLLCFAVNVKSSSLAVIPPASSCEVERGLVVGSVGPGQSLSLDMLEGTADFEIYGFLRNSASDPCPQVTPAAWNFPMKKIYFLGKSVGVAVTSPSTDVAITIALPSPNQNLVAQNSMPASCNYLGAPFVGKNFGRSEFGAKVLKGTQFSAYSRITTKPEIKTLSGSQFKIVNWKASTE